MRERLVSFAKRKEEASRIARMKLINAFAKDLRSHFLLNLVYKFFKQFIN